MRKLIVFESWNFEDFELEILNNDFEKVIFVYNDNLVRFIEFLFERHRISDEKVINFLVNENLDLMFKIKSKKFWNENLELLKFVNFEFESQDLIVENIGFDCFRNYCKFNKLDLVKTESSRLKEELKFDLFFQKFNNFKEFKICFEYFKKSLNLNYFMFVDEVGLKRFIFSNFIINNKNKESFLGLVRSLNLNEKLVEIITRVNLDLSNNLFHLSFKYNKNNLLDRISFYFEFERNLLEDVKIEYLRSLNGFDSFNFDLICNQIRMIAFDFFLRQDFEFKIYFKRSFNDLKFQDQRIEKIFKKPSTLCFKIKNGKVIDKKFEFDINDLKKEDFEFLDINLEKLDFNILAIYLDKKKSKIKKIKKYYF